MSLAFRHLFRVLDDGKASTSTTVTGTLLRNGAVPTPSVTVTIATAGSQSYQASATVPDAWEVGDEVHLRVNSTVAGTVGNHTDEAAFFLGRIVASPDGGTALERVGSNVKTFAVVV